MEGTELLGLATVITTAGFVLRTLIVNYRRHKVAQTQAQIMGKLIDRIGSSPELGKWLESGGPQQFLELESERTSPYTRILNSVQTGIIAGALGAGLMAIAGSEREIYSAGLLLTIAGAGFLVSAGASYVLSRTWGILKPNVDAK